MREDPCLPFTQQPAAGYRMGGQGEKSKESNLLDDLFGRLPRALDVAQHALHKVEMHSPGHAHPQVHQRPAQGIVLLSRVLPLIKDCRHRSVQGLQNAGPT